MAYLHKMPDCGKCLVPHHMVPRPFPRPPGKSPSGKLIVDIEKYRPISRLGGNTYGRVLEIFDLPRPDRGPAEKPLHYTSKPE